MNYLLEVSIYEMNMKWNRFASLAMEKLFCPRKKQFQSDLKSENRENCSSANFYVVQ